MHQCSCMVILRLSEELLEHVIDREQSSNDCRSDLNEIGNDTTFNSLKLLLIPHCSYTT